MKRENQRKCKISPAAYKESLGTKRKTAQPLLLQPCHLLIVSRKFSVLDIQFQVLVREDSFLFK
jgi:hypothetical protein